MLQALTDKSPKFSQWVNTARVKDVLVSVMFIARWIKNFAVNSRQCNILPFFASWDLQSSMWLLRLYDFQSALQADMLWWSGNPLWWQTTSGSIKYEFYNWEVLSLPQKQHLKFNASKCKTIAYRVNQVSDSTLQLNQLCKLKFSKSSTMSRSCITFPNSPNSFACRQNHVRRVFFCFWFDNTLS